MSSSNTLLASHPQACCFTGFKHTGNATGHTVPLGGMDTYISGDDAHPRVILYFCDVFGPGYINNQLIMDYFASLGFLVLSPDYFFNDPIQNHQDNPNHDRQAWVSKTKAQAAAATPKWIEAVKNKYGEEVKYSAVGYCFGAPYVMQLAATDDIVAAAIAHPSSLSEDDFRKVKQPLLLSCAETDRAFPTPSRRAAEDILVEKSAKYHFQVFSGVSHGFAVRGDEKNPDERWAKEESARGIGAWFTRFST
ncbi:hypothetical protein JAAARDRAFT_43121 [Jaapia argillacea MUCL 33604]|uniref:Dienelactone hydrolase domain-containing protein n=1 Tax=Jaapia argillacea MUCL 33604 TaxID=933084 RepID=A0A067PDE7_9AGAM|nr:hypothetical protein JAAARDRAFT_43121 [Jaapia argillacea MUCL 33604]